MDRIELSELKSPVAIIRINQFYNDSLTPDELYDVTRGYWNRNRRKAECCRLAFAVYHGIVKEVYEVDEWVDGDAIHMMTGINPCRPNSYGFNGRVATDSVRNLYLGRSVAHLFKHGDRNSVRVFGGDIKGNGHLA